MKPWLVGLAAVACGAVWLVADVALSYDGHLTGLYYTGSDQGLPPGPVGEHTCRVRDARGYDGAYYHLIAHDPLNRRGFLAYVDTAEYRWRRIGIPGLAWVLGLGNDALIDPMYVGLELLSVFVGAFWLARCAVGIGRSAAWGLAFLLVPATAVSLDRLTVDLPLAALAMGLIWYARDDSEPRWPAYLVLAFAPLVRETGLILVLAWCVLYAMQRRWRVTMAGAACTIPTIAWWSYVSLHSAHDRTSFLTPVPLGGLITWTLHALRDPVAVYGPRAAAVLELLALAGIWVAFALVVWIAVRRGWRFPELVAMLFAFFTAWIGYQDIWASAFGIGRTLSPLLLALAWIALRDRRRIYAAPLALIVPRIALQLASEIKVALA
ncbi:MAG TPA: hypothetical protein VMJ34_20210 [Bryobacteraceae bacterium]|nr:hypothetical protein [Bryobacteraceae bacterium]